MNRYSIIYDKNPREIILLRSHRCKWGRCFFCDYISDNMDDEKAIVDFNSDIIDRVTGEFGSLEVINSGSVFEIPLATLKKIREKVRERNIEKLYFESHYMYRHRLQEIRHFFEGTEVIFKCGIETFNEDMRNGYLNKNIHLESPEEAASYFESICLLVGFKGQKEEDIDRDMETLLKYFKRGCINIYTKNSTPVEEDHEIVEYFRRKWSHLERMDNIEILWNNTDFGVGDILIENKTGNTEEKDSDKGER